MICCTLSISSPAHNIKGKKLVIRLLDHIIPY
jgi:hypothetical protein